MYLKKGRVTHEVQVLKILACNRYWDCRGTCIPGAHGTWSTRASQSSLFQIPCWSARKSRLRWCSEQGLAIVNWRSLTIRPKLTVAVVIAIKARSGVSGRKAWHARDLSVAYPRRSSRGFDAAMNSVRLSPCQPRSCTSSVPGERSYRQALV